MVFFYINNKIQLSLKYVSLNLFIYLHCKFYTYNYFLSSYFLFIIILIKSSYIFYAFQLVKNFSISFSSVYCPLFYVCISFMITIFYPIIFPLYFWCRTIFFYRCWSVTILITSFYPASHSVILIVAVFFI